MALLETAAEYILGIIVEDDNFKKFPKEFIGESVKWVKSWFLTPEDPKTTAKLEDPKKSVEYKKDIIDDKLEELKENSTFMQELTAKIQAYEAHNRTSLNTIDDTELDVKGSFRQGNISGETGDESSNKAMEKNTIKRSKITVGGDFRQRDDISQGNIITNNYNAFDKKELEKEFISRKELEETLSGLEQDVKEFYLANDKNGIFAEHYAKGEKAPPQYQSLKSELKALVAQNKTVLVFNKLLDHLERQDETHYNTVLLLFGQYNRLNEKENGGLVSFADANIERNRLNNGLIATIDGLTFE